MIRRASVPGDDSSDRRPDDGGAIEAAAFIAESISELTQLAHRHQLDVLGFLLDMALLEARDVQKKSINKRRD